MTDSKEFDPHARCDRCIAKAMVIASKDGLELSFCSHHGNRHKDKLESDGWSLFWDEETKKQYEASHNIVSVHA